MEGVADVAVDLIDRLPEIGQQVAEGIGSAFGAVYNGRHCWGSIGRGAAIGSMLGPLGTLAGGAVGGLIAQDDCVDAVEYAFDAAGDVYEATQIVFSDIYCPDGSIAVVLQQVGPAVPANWSTLLASEHTCPRRVLPPIPRDMCSTLPLRCSLMQECVNHCAAEAGGCAVEIYMDYSCCSCAVSCDSNDSPSTSEPTDSTGEEYDTPTTGSTGTDATTSEDTSGAAEASGQRAHVPVKAVAHTA